MRVRELLRRKPSKVITVEATGDVGTAVRLLMKHGVGGLPVVDAEGFPAGFLAERDIVVAVDANSNGIRNLPAEKIMRRPAPTCSGDDSLRDVMARMTRKRLRHLVVVDGDRITGVISVGDLVKHRLDELETETGVLRDYVAAQRARG